MAKTKKKRSQRTEPEDENTIAARVVTEATEHPDEESDEKPEKNPAAVALGRLGGKKGGPARAKKLSKKRRSEIAARAANARWKNQQ